MEERYVGPLDQAGTVIGGLQFVLTDAERRYSEDDLTLAEAVAGRVASAIENRRLTDQQHLIASTLQGSLLPDRLPDIPNLAVAVRYWASGARSPTGLVPHRGPSDPAPPRYRRRPRGTVAGHPLPAIVAVDGTARLAGEPGTLLGAFEDIALRPTAERLAPGDTLVLYTDGVGDVAPPHGLDEDEVTRLLVDAASGAGPAPPEAIADRIDDRLAAVLPMDDRTDDVALLILQVPPVD